MSMERTLIENYIQSTEYWVAALLSEKHILVFSGCQWEWGSWGPAGEAFPEAPVEAGGMVESSISMELHPWVSHFPGSSHRRNVAGLQES